MRHRTGGLLGANALDGVFVTLETDDRTHRTRLVASVDDPMHFVDLTSAGKRRVRPALRSHQWADLEDILENRTDPGRGRRCQRTRPTRFTCVRPGDMRAMLFYPEEGYQRRARWPWQQRHGAGGKALTGGELAHTLIRPTRCGYLG